MTAPQPLIYGVTVFACVFFAGWVTGLGGALLASLGFSALMGALAGFLFAMVKRFARRKGGD